MRKTAIITVLCLFFAASGIFILRSGDIFFSFLSKELEIDMKYKNSVGLTSCFLLKFVDLQDVSFTPIEAKDVTLKCRKAYALPKFDKILSEKTIFLKLILRDAYFDIKQGDSAALGSVSYADSLAIIREIGGMAYEDMFVDLLIKPKRVEILSFDAFGKDSKIRAAGYVTEDKDIDIDITLFFSSEITSKMPGELSSFLTEENAGWKSYHARIAADSKTMSFNMESDMLNIKFKEISK